MSDQRKNTKISGDLFEVERAWRGGANKLKVSIFGSTEKEVDHKVEVIVDFECLPNIIDKLRKEWLAERDYRSNQIHSVNRALNV